MTTEKLYATLKFLDALDQELGIQSNLEQIRDLLNNLVAAPANAGHQGNLANALATFSEVGQKLRELITTSQSGALREMGGGEFFDPGIADKVKGSISVNAMTPSVARDFVQDLASRRAGFMTTVRQAVQALERLGISAEGVALGAADVAFLIPRDLFKNHLEEFAKELKFINHLVRDFTEALTGQAEPVQLQQLSSSVPTIALAAKGIVIEAIAKVVNLFLDAWKKIEEIREIRAKLQKLGMRGSALEELTQQITTKVDEVIEESTTIVMMSYLHDAGRRNELENAVRKDARRLFAQIERGLTVEFRANPNPNDEDQDNQKTLASVADLSKRMQFPPIQPDPILLGNAEILEDSPGVVAVSKKTTTHRTTTKVEKNGKPEVKVEQ